MARWLFFFTREGEETPQVEDAADLREWKEDHPGATLLGGQKFEGGQPTGKIGFTGGLAGLFKISRDPADEE